MFNTKWKSMYEKHRKRIEEVGYDQFINEPFDLVSVYC